MTPEEKNLWDSNQATWQAIQQIPDILSNYLERCYSETGEHQLHNVVERRLAETKHCGLSIFFRK
jgi:hypothetical protein